jgi:hypothetical protein
MTEGVSERDNPGARPALQQDRLTPRQAALLNLSLRRTPREPIWSPNDHFGTLMRSLVDSPRSLAFLVAGDSREGGGQLEPARRTSFRRVGTTGLNLTP